MKTTYNKRVDRINEVEQKVEATVKTIRNNSSSPRILLRVAAVVLPLIALSYLSISQQDKINAIYTQMASLNPFTPTEIAERVVEKMPEKVIEVDLTPRIIDPSIAEEAPIPIITTSNTYYIIAGAFTEQKNAEKMLTKLSQWGYKPEIVDAESLLRVSYESFENRAEAVIALNKIRKENKSAWLLTK